LTGLLKSTVVLIVLSILAGCSSSDNRSPSDINSPELRNTSGAFEPPGTHVQISHSVSFDPETGEIEIVPDRTTLTHVDLTWLWKYYAGMLKIDILNHDPVAHVITVSAQFKNPLQRTLGDVRAIFLPDGDLVPVNFDGWTTRGGADIENPDVYIAFGRNMPDGRLDPYESDTREITFSYNPPLKLKIISFVLDATLSANTAEPYAFGTPHMTGRFFCIQISDWQDDITTAFLHPSAGISPAPFRMAPFGDGMWGTSIFDIPPGNYRWRVTAESPESPGEDERTAVAVHWVDLKWPPDGPLVPLPTGLGIYGYGFRDPDTNLPPTDPAAAMEKLKTKMGGKWILTPFGYVCNSGYLSMSSQTPGYVQAMHNADPNIPVHLNLDKITFPPQEYDPCMHPPEKYTQLFWDHLLESIRGQILENPKFDCVSGIHFDIEIHSVNYTETELRAIYHRYADFLARLHLEPSLRGRNITCYEFDFHPHNTPEDLPYLCTVDAFLPEVYYTRFTWSWDPSIYPTPYFYMQKELATYDFWSLEYGRPFYPILATFAGWIDGNEDTLGLITPCAQRPMRMIDDTCFGNSAFNTMDEFAVVKDRAVHGMYIEKVILNIPEGDPIYPSSGLAVYRLGDSFPTTVGDDIIACRTAYAMARAVTTVEDYGGRLMPGIGLFRYENNMSWKAAIFGDPIERGAIAGLSGRIRFIDHLSLQQHPELWEGITVNLLDPLTPEIIESPVYRTSVDLVGIDDGSYLFYDLPPEVVTIQAEADGWQSSTATVDLRGFFEYEDNVDLMMYPE
jgi:hypothetical protein